MMKAVDSLSNLVRAIVSVALLGTVAAGSWFGYKFYSEKELAVQQRDKLLIDVKAKEAEIKQQQEQIERLDMALRLLKVDHHLAKLAVVDQFTNDDGKLMTTVQFAEVDDQGHPLDASRVQNYTIEGDIVYIDGMVAKFADEFVEQGDPLRGTSIFWFKSLFGAKQAPADGFPLSLGGEDPRPAAYAKGREMTDLEKKIWSNFWDYANDSEKAKQVGLRAIHGQAPSIQVRKGKLYWIELRATGDVWIRPGENLPESKPK